MLKFPLPFLAIVLASASSLVSGQSVPIEDLNAIDAALDREVRSQFGAFSFDILDFPQPPGVPLALKSINGEGTVDIDRDFPGQIVVTAEVNPKSSTCGERWRGDNPAALADMRRLYDEYAGKGVQLIAVWSFKAGDAAAARAYAEQHPMPWPFLLDEKAKAPKGVRGQSRYHQYINSFVPGHPEYELAGIRDANGNLVYKGRDRLFGFNYHVTRHLLDRLLDPTYDQAVRAEFTPGKPRHLPQVEMTTEGLVYRDDFESYPDSHAFKLEPRWGFRYHNQSRLGERPEIAPGEGRDGSQAVHYAHQFDSLGLVPYGMELVLPEPLSNGEIRFFVRRGPGDAVRLPPTGFRATPGANVQRAFALRLDQPGSYEAAGYLTAAGPWPQETFVLGHEVLSPGKVKFAKDAWQEVTITCRPGAKAKVAVDGVEIGELGSESVSALHFQAGSEHKTFYIDDFEVLYRGDGPKLGERHRALLAAADARRGHAAPYPEDLRRRLQFEAQASMAGQAPPVLDPGDSPRADANGRQVPWLTFQQPLQARPLVLEDLNQPGQKVDVTQQFPGQIIMVTKMHKGDHTTEEAMRARTALRSPTVFHRLHRLSAEYRPKGVAFVGVGTVDGGHRDIANDYGEKRRQSFDNAAATQGVLADFDVEPEHVIYGCYPEDYDLLVGERFPNQLKAWNETLNGNFMRGQFAGMGVDTIIDAQGRIVYRGYGPDGIGYWKARYVLDRLLDPEFDRACRVEFRDPQQPYYFTPLLPVREPQADGLLCRDDFDSYADTYDFGLQPRWGFTYANYPDEMVPAIFPGEGIGGSQAVLLNHFAPADAFCGNITTPASRHELLLPLEDGEVRFQLKRGMHVKNFGKPPLYRFGLVAYGPDGEPVGQSLTTFGEWEDEEIVFAPTKEFVAWTGIASAHSPRARTVNDGNITRTGVKMSDDWFEVALVCRPGQDIEVRVDGQAVGTLPGQALGAVEFYEEAWSGTWLDQFEVFYRGDARAIEAKLKQAEKDDYAKRMSQWQQEVSAGS